MAIKYKTVSYIIFGGVLVVWVQAVTIISSDLIRIIYLQNFSPFMGKELQTSTKFFPQISCSYFRYADLNVNFELWRYKNIKALV